MTKDELIVAQALRLEEQANRLALLNENMREIHRVIYCVGGPLNDNYLQYSPEQRAPFARIAEWIQVNGDGK